MADFKQKLARARPKLEKKLARGWQRAVFATPQREDGSADQRVLDGPGALEPSDARFASEFEVLMTAAESAAAAGLVKHTFVLDERERVELDARHGHVKQRTLDDAMLAKIMGGKDKPLRPDHSDRLLRSIGIMNADGTISARNAKKYKQVNHFVEICRPLWVGREAGTEPLRIVDLACGNSYLGFVVVEALGLDQRPARLLGIDVREDVIATSRARAQEIGQAANTDFLVSTLEQLDRATLERQLGGPVDLAISLHACDTATDAALALAITSGVGAILCVPCCHAELARQLEGLTHKQRQRSPAGLVPAALEHGLLRRTLAEVLTDALRVELLEACGYTVATVEFVAAAHTPKNLLLRAVRSHPRAPADWRLGPIAARCEQLGVDPALLRALLQVQSTQPGDSL